MGGRRSVARRIRAPSRGGFTRQCIARDDRGCEGAAGGGLQRCTLQAWRSLSRMR